MGRKRRLLLNTGLLTSSALMTRAVSMAFQAWLASRIGAAGIGLYQLMGSVTALFSAIAVSGIRFTVTRLVSEEAGRNNGDGVDDAVRSCLCYASFFGLAAGAALFLLAEPVGFLWAGDARSVAGLRIAAAGLPILALSSVFSGYFTAAGSIWKAVLVQLFEQLLGAAFVVLLLRIVTGDLSQACASIIGGNVAAAALMLLIWIPVYVADRRRYGKGGLKSAGMTRRMLAVAIPLAVSTYTRTALGTLEHLLIPRGLRLAGCTAETALEQYGLVHGMALPAVLFPACLLFALAELIVPELTRAQVQGNRKQILRLVRKTRRCTLLYAFVTAAVLAGFSQTIAARIFHTPEAAKYIRMLAPLIPVMNLDTTTDGCLRGLGKQGLVMLINVLDAALGVALVVLLLPRLGITGYLGMIWITECGNLLLSTAALQLALHANKKEPPGNLPGGNHTKQAAGIQRIPASFSNSTMNAANRNSVTVRNTGCTCPLPFGPSSISLAARSEPTTGL